MQKELYNKIIKNGKFYCPATSHYNNSNNIQCDRCYKNNLKTCIGYEEYDLCLECVDKITNINEIESNLTYMEQNIFNIKPINRLTRMEQNIFKIYDKPKYIEDQHLTLMEQKIYNTPLTKMKQDLFKYDDIFNKKNNLEYILNKKNRIYDSIEIDNRCLQSFPCQHRIKVNDKSLGLMNGKEITKKYWDYMSNLQKEHFKIYLDKICY